MSEFIAFGVNSDLFTFISSFLKHWTIRIAIGRIPLNEFKLNSGLPQNSILYPAPLQVILIFIYIIIYYLLLPITYFPGSNTI